VRGLVATLLALFPIGGTGAAGAHELVLDTTSGAAVLLDLRYGDGTPFSYESYEIRAEGEGIPFQTGRTDSNGRVAFAPGRPGTWRITARSEDGHGVDATFETLEGGGAAPARRPWFDRYPRILAGAGVILGLFGLAQLWSIRRRRPPGEEIEG
jgi:nickel transport protein